MAEIDRNKKLAEIKASIELLEECKQKINDNPKLDENAKKDRIEQIDEAIKENYDNSKDYNKKNPSRCPYIQNRISGQNHRRTCPKELRSPSSGIFHSS